MRSVSFCLSSFAPTHLQKFRSALLSIFLSLRSESFSKLSLRYRHAPERSGALRNISQLETTGIFIIDVFQWEIFTNQKNFGALFERCICILLGRLVAHSGTGTTPLRPILKFLLYSCSEPNPMFRSTLGIESFRALQVEHVLNMLITNMIQILLLGP